MYHTDEDDQHIPLYLLLHCVSACGGGLDKLHLSVILVKVIDIYVGTEATARTLCCYFRDV